MNELTPEKWQELHEKLEGEMEEAQAREKAMTLTAGKLILAALVLLGVTGGLLWVLSDVSWGRLAAMLPGLLFLISVLYVMRYRKLASLARSDIERIQRDIRQWKKKRPSGTGKLPKG
ncbi:MAG: hypothetical protein KDB82_02795 [Planctomycetes bacterium]|nr:hypothetical protein [Planctomycetota bacterium]